MLLHCLYREPQLSVEHRLMLCTDYTLILASRCGFATWLHLCRMSYSRVKRTKTLRPMSAFISKNPERYRPKFRKVPKARIACAKTCLFPLFQSKGRECEKTLSQQQREYSGKERKESHWKIDESEHFLARLGMTWCGLAKTLAGWRLVAA